MKESFRRSRRCSPTLLAWIAALSLGGCARAHYDGTRAGADADRDRGERTTRDPVTADDDRDEDEEEDAPPVGINPPSLGAAPAPAGSRPVAPPPGVAPPPVTEPTTGELMAELFVEYQRDGSLRCPCHVATGVYATLEECLDAAVRQRPKVNDCLDRSVPPDALKELRNWVRCITEIKREHNACLERASCEDPMSCTIDTKRCTFPDAMRVAMAINQCPQAVTVGP
jgi:hypothetical protein